MKSGIRALDGFPCVTIPSNARDSHYQVLGWQQVAAKIGMQRCAASSQWLNDRISLSRYAHVPVGNFELDWLVFTADLFFSRALRDQQQVLLISDDGVPDLGGINEEDTCFADEVHQPVLTYPGAYRKITVELKIHHLAVNALLKSNQVNEMEGGALLGYDQDMHSGAPVQNEHVGFDEDTACAPAFRVLKQLIQRCLADAVTFGNVYADAILQHLYRWLCSPESKLHDPALHRILHKVMQKVFALLLAEFRKLGATIIFANFSKVIIDTGKFDLSAAKAYCDSLLKTLQKRCVITGVGGTSYAYLGRPWGPFGRVVYAYTYMDACIKHVGWDNLGKTENERSACFYEYRCYGPGSCPSKRVAWARELIDEEAEQFLMHRFIDPDSQRPWLAQRMALRIPYSA